MDLGSATTSYLLLIADALGSPNHPEYESINCDLYNKESLMEVTI